MNIIIIKKTHIFFFLEMELNIETGLQPVLLMPTTSRRGLLIEMRLY